MSRTAAPSAPAEAVDQAARTISEAAQQGAEYAERALSTIRAYLPDALALSPKLFEGSGTDIQALVKAGFGFQNAILQAMPPLMDAGVDASKSVLEAYTAMVEQQQHVVLRAWKRAIESTEHLAPTAK
jgi:hypothetical protein